MDLQAWPLSSDKTSEAASTSTKFGHTPPTFRLTVYMRHVTQCSPYFPNLR